MTLNGKTFTVTAVLAVAGLLLSLCAGMIHAADAPAVGAMAPDFKLTSESGSPVSLHEFKGNWVIMYFYPKDFTKGCTIEAHGFQTDMPQYEAKKAVIVGVSVDTADSHKDFCAKEGLSFKLLADTEHQVSALYGSLSDNGVAKRNTFILNPQGKIVKEFIAVEPTKHSAEVLAALDEAQKEK